MGSPGAAAVAVAPDNTAFTVSYGVYKAELGARKNCFLSVLVHVPQGFTYAIAHAEYRGYADLAPGAIGTESARYYFQGQTGTVDRSHSWTGPVPDGGNWQANDSTDLAALVYAPCGALRNFNINTSLTVSKGTSTAANPGSMTMDSTDTSIDTVYQFHWARCK